MCIRDRAYSAEYLQSLNVSNFEMESATLYTLAHLKKLRAASVCAVYANRIDNGFADDIVRKNAEDKCIRLTLDSMYEVIVHDRVLLGLD